MKIPIKTSLVDDENMVLDVVKCGQEYCNSNKRSQVGVRPFYSLHFVLFGKGVLKDGSGKEYHINKNEIFLLYENEFYDYHPDEFEPWSYIWVDFTGEEIDKFLLLCGFEKDNLVKRGKDFNEYVEMMRRMYEAYDATEVQQLRISAYLMLILGKLIEQEQEKKLSLRELRKVKTLRDIIVYINNNYASAALTNEIIASVNGMSVRSLNLLFSEVLDMSPVEYILNYKISLACEKLARPDMTINEVAKEAGFDDSKYFARVFKKIKGITPSEYAQLPEKDDPFGWIKEKGFMIV